MLDRVKVPPPSSAVPSWPAAPRTCRRFSSWAIWKILSSCTFFTLGTSRPWLVSMARPMLWEAWRSRGGGGEVGVVEVLKVEEDKKEEEEEEEDGRKRRTAGGQR